MVFRFSLCDFVNCLSMSQTFGSKRIAMTTFVNIIWVSLHFEIRIRFRSPVKRVKRSYDSLSFYGEVFT